MEGTPIETGPDGEPYFALAPPRKNRVWPFIVAILIALVVVPVLLFLSVRGRSHETERTHRDEERSGSGSGRVVEFDARYPSTALVEGLLEEPVELGGWHHYFGLLPDPDGAPALLYGNEGTYDWRGPDLLPGKAFETERPLKRLVRTGAPRAPYVAILSRKDAHEAETVNGLSASGATIWSWTGRDARFLKWLAPLFAEAGGPAGCAVGAGGKEGLLGLAADGSVLWQWPKRHVIYEVRTHRALAGWILQVSGLVFLERHDASEPPAAPARDLRSVFEPEFLYMEHAVLFPTTGGSPAVVWAGTAKPIPRDEPVLARVDAGDGDPAARGAKQIWRARPETKPAGLAMLEPPGRTRLFAVTTEGGELLVFDEDGALRARTRMPRTEKGALAATYALEAGPLGKDGWAIVVALLQGTFVYRVHPEKLPPR